MQKTELLAKDVVDMFEIAYEYLKNSSEEINNLNVFPVPDGDTGTNMLLTLGSVVAAFESKNPQTFPEIAETATQAALLGARGNSGVILSQIIKGFLAPLKENNYESIKTKEFAVCLESARQTAYRAITKPVEGTILTVLRKTAEAAKGMRKKRGLELPDMLEVLVEAAEEALKETPDLLPVLKEAGVVDAGGLGLVVILRAFRDFTAGSRRSEEKTEEYASAFTKKSFAQEEITYTYCTEILVRSNILDTELAINYLNSKGDSVLVVRDGEVVKIHVHTDYPAEVISHFGSFGEFIDIKVNNMRIQTEEANKKREEITRAETAVKKLKSKSIAVVAVAQGTGIKKIFESLGVDIVVEGGQTMNPSSEEILQAVEQAPSDRVIILPNNKNIILAAEQAVKLTKKTAFIVPSKTVQQGLQAILSFNPEFSLEENLERMKSSLKDVVSVDITRSVRTTTINGLAIEKGDYIGIVENEIVASGKDLVLTLVRTLEKAGVEEGSFITVFTGKELSMDEVELVEATLEKNFPDVDFEVKFGGQEHYPLLLAVER